MTDDPTNAPSAADPSDEEAFQQDQRASSLRAGLDAYELEDADWEVLAGAPDGGADSGTEGPPPVLAVIGRPNVGKSTLVNRFLGHRAAVVQDTPGVTRDRVSYAAEWAGRRFTVVDTGGWQYSTRGLGSRVAEQAEIAIELADAVLFVVDATVGPTDEDERVVRLLRRAKKPTLLVANKVDDQRGEADAATLWSLGLGEPHPVSAMHGRGSGDLLDAAVAMMPQTSEVHGAIPEGGPRRVALVGRPNVGKSSLLNQLTNTQRSVVDDVAGTTRDPVDELVMLDERAWWFVDTAGIRRRVHQSSGADFYASLRTQGALEKAEVAVVLIDASDVLTEQDVRVVQQVIDAGRALVIAYNKWDLVDDERRHYLEKEIEQQLVQVPWAPRINISATTGWHTNRLTRALDTALASWDRRIGTGKLNAFLGELSAAHPHPVRGGKQPRILFGTQADSRPPRFVLFATGFLEAGYRRYIERRLREEFSFAGTPIEISVRVRAKRRR